MNLGSLDDAARETLQLLLAAWGAGLATLLAFIDIRARLNDRWKLLVWADATPTALSIEVVNAGRQPVTVTGVELWYSDDWLIRQLVWSKTEQFRLDPSDRFPIHEARAVIRAEVVARSIKQVYDCRLKVRVKTATRAEIANSVLIDSALVPSEYSAGSHSRVGSDVFLGFDPIEERRVPSPLGLR